MAWRIPGDALRTHSNSDFSIRIVLSDRQVEWLQKTAQNENEQEASIHSRQSERGHREGQRDSLPLRDFDLTV